MARQPTGNPPGRPLKEINWEQFEQLCALQCTQSEIASFLKINPETLSIRVKSHYGEGYPDAYKKYSEVGKCSLRRYQFVLSKKNATMAIWLGKQWLGQRDTSKEEIKDIVEELKDAIRESEERPRTSEVIESNLEIKQSLLDQRCAGQESQISDELGTERTL